MTRINHQDRAYNFIKEQIINLILAPGTRILAHDLARQLRLSRTPVREALSRLEQDGLIERTAGWGYTVRSLTLKEIVDMFKLRETLEVEAAHTALRYMDRATLTALRKINSAARAMVAKGRVTEARALNRRFHLTISAAARNDLLQRLLLIINDRIRLVGSMHLGVRSHRISENVE